MWKVSYGCEGQDVVEEEFDSTAQAMAKCQWLLDNSWKIVLVWFRVELAD